MISSGLSTPLFLSPFLRFSRRTDQVVVALCFQVIDTRNVRALVALRPDFKDLLDHANGIGSNIQPIRSYTPLGIVLNFTVEREDFLQDALVDVLDPDEGTDETAGNGCVGVKIGRAHV